MPNATDSTGEFDVSALMASLGVDVSPEILTVALTHTSFAYEHGGNDNERLEFLGDAIVGQAITAALFHAYPDLPEGELAKRRASIVSTQALAEVARGIGLGQFLRLGNGEELTGGRDKPSLLADAWEAVVGAVFLDQGPEVANDLVTRFMGSFVDDAARRSEASDPKTTLQEWAAKSGRGVPRYNISDDGPDHQKTFTADVFVEGYQGGTKPAGRGTGSSKKAAELAAASAALEVLRDITPDA